MSEFEISEKTVELNFKGSESDVKILLEQLDAKGFYLSEIQTEANEDESVGSLKRINH